MLLDGYDIGSSGDGDLYAGTESGQSLAEGRHEISVHALDMYGGEPQPPTGWTGQVRL